MYLFNGKIYNDDKLSLRLNDRGFWFGDGFFESMAVVNKKVPLIEFHQLRIKKGFEEYRLGNYSDFITRLQSYIKEITINCSTNSYYRLKLAIWRKGSGKYFSDAIDFNFLITIKKEEFKETQIKVGYDNNRVVSSHLFKAVKPLAPFIYTESAKWCKANQYAEELIFNSDGILVESTSSSIIWGDGNKAFYNNELGIMGVMVEKIKSSTTLPLIFKLTSFKDLEENCKWMVLCNVFSIKKVESIKGKQISKAEDFGFEFETPLFYHN